MEVTNTTNILWEGHLTWQNAEKLSSLMTTVLGSNADQPRKRFDYKHYLNGNNKPCDSANDLVLKREGNRAGIQHDWTQIAAHTAIIEVTGCNKHEDRRHFSFTSILNDGEEDHEFRSAAYVTITSKGVVVQKRERDKNLHIYELIVKDA